MPEVSAHPLTLAPILLPKVWGGRRLGALGKAIPEGVLIGESWELADLAATSASGAGGQAVRSTIAGGPLAGRTLAEAVGLWGKALMGDLPDAAAFPLLVKFLDATENLSVQVHPSPTFASTRPDAHLKTESWYILEADPGALLYIGINAGVRRAAFAAAARAGSAEVAAMLRPVPAVAGECHTLPSGTVHALGAGITVAEVQTPSDTTFRVYDWGRTGREVHVADALRCIRFEDDPPEARTGAHGEPTVQSLGEGELCGRLATTARYTIDEARPLAGDELTIGYACRGQGSAPFVLVTLAGAGELIHPEGSFAPEPVGVGATVLVPAAVARATVLRAGAGLRVLRVGLCSDEPRA